MDEAESQETTPVVRGPGGRFVVPPRNGGRPKGKSQSELVRKLIEPKRQELVDRLLKIALTSTEDIAVTRALDMALSRLAPPPRQESERVHVPGLASALTFTGKADAVIAAVASGEISAEAGEKLLRLLDVYRRAHETDNLQRRVEALEQGKTLDVVEAIPARGDV